MTSDDFFSTLDLVYRTQFRMTSYFLSLRPLDSIETLSTLEGKQFPGIQLDGDDALLKRDSTSSNLIRQIPASVVRRDVSWS